MANELSVIEVISKIDDLLEVHNYMGDEDLDEALSLVVKLISQPHVPSAKVVPLIVKLQAISSKMQIQAALYRSIKKNKTGTPEFNKKEIYYSMSDALQKLVDALKYAAKYDMV